MIAVRGDVSSGGGPAAPRPTVTKISVVGTGYLGATHAVCMSELGFTVVGLDVDEAKVASLGSGVVPFFEPGLEELLRKNLEAGRLTFSSSFEDAADADAHFLCVGTPQRPDSPAADMRYLDSAMDSLLAAGLRPGALVIGKSTVPAGTAARLAARLAAEAPQASLGWNPEFLREGFAVEDTLRPDRLVFGVPADDDGRAEAVLREIYAQPLDAGTPLIVADFATAELVKVAANSFLATKISFINAMAEVCEATGGDVTVLAKALSYDTRIGGRFLGSGVGFGGGCLPKDIRAFQARAQELNVGRSVAFLGEVDAINLRRRARVVELATEAVGGDVAGKRVAVFGAAFKPNSDDIRDSPALDVASALHKAGAAVTVCDPAAIPHSRRRHPELRYELNALDAAVDADVVLHLTEWAEFREIDPAVLAATVRTPVVIDGRNTLDAARWRQAGWTYLALGRPAL